VPQVSFQSACDRLSQSVDSIQYERLRWAKHEGPILARLVALAQAAIEDRGEFELAEEGASSDRKRFVLKVHGTRVVAISFWVADGQAQVSAETVVRSKYAVNDGCALSVEYAALDELWMAGALHELFSRIVEAEPSA
jgi:hypothetical protein